jgi:serine/threonine-protein kinase SRK2
MGGCCTKPEDSYQQGEGKKKKRRSSGSGKKEGRKEGKRDGKKQEKKDVPDFGFGEIYEVVKLLGAGGEGETWLCIDKEKSEEVAIKVGGRGRMRQRLW